MNSIFKLLFSLVLLLWVPVFSAHAAVGQKCLEPLSAALEKAENEKRPSAATSTFAPPECQYFNVDDLDDAFRQRLAKALHARGNQLIGDAKLSSVFGLLKLSSRAASDVPAKADPCEAQFYSLIHHQKESMALATEAHSRSECYRYASNFSKETGSMPRECNKPIELTSIDFRDFYQKLSRNYQSETQKEIPDRFSFAYNALQNQVYKVLSQKCNARK